MKDWRGLDITVGSVVVFSHWLGYPVEAEVTGFKRGRVLVHVLRSARPIDLTLMVQPDRLTVVNLSKSTKLTLDDEIINSMKGI